MTSFLPRGRRSYVNLPRGLRRDMEDLAMAGQRPVHFISRDLVTQAQVVNQGGGAPPPPGLNVRNNSSGITTAVFDLYGRDSSGQMALALAADGAVVEPQWQALQVRGPGAVFAAMTVGPTMVYLENAAVVPSAIGNYGWLSALTGGTVTPIPPDDPDSRFMVGRFLSVTPDGSGRIDFDLSIFTQGGGMG